MASLAGHDSRQYSWLWVSHISPKNSKWLQENLSDMDIKVKAMIKLINEDADSFARRAEMYYKKRPELMKLVEEFYRAYRALAERYDQATGALRHAHKTISEAFPNQMPSMSDEAPTSLGKEAEPHTPEMSTFIHGPFDSDDLHKDALGVSPEHIPAKRNGTHPEETSALSSRKGLKQFNDLLSTGENAARASSDGKVRKVLSFESPEVKEKADIRNEMLSLQQEVSRLLAESQNLKQQISLESERADKADSEIQSLKDTVLHLNSEKDAAVLQYNQSTEKLSTVESELSQAHAELKKLTDDMALEVQKLNSAERRNDEIQSELEALDQKVKVQQQELEQKKKEIESFHLSLQEEREKRLQAETALLSEEKQCAQSQEEAERLTLEIKEANDKLNEFKQMKMDMENIILELKKEVDSLTEQNHSSGLFMQELRDEINSRKDSKNQLEGEIQSLRSTIMQVNIERDAALLQHQQSVERMSDLESQLLKLQSEIEKTEQKVQMLVQDLEQKREEADSVHAQLKDECCRHKQTKAALLTTEGLHYQLQDKVEKLAQDLESLTKKLCELENDKLYLQNMSQELKNTILDLNSENDAALIQQQQSLEKVSLLEGQLLKKQLKLEEIEEKTQTLEQELEQKNEKVDSLQRSLQEEGQKCLQAEEALLVTHKLHSKSQEEVHRLLLDLERLNNKLSEIENSKLSLENLSCELKNTISVLNSEKDAALLQQHQSLEKVSALELQLSTTQLELEKTEHKVQMLEQELAQKSENVDNLKFSLKHESEQRVQAETTLMSMEDMYSQSQEEVSRLYLEIEKLNDKLSELENASSELKSTVLVLNSEKETNLINHHQSLVRVSDLESELSKLQAELEKVEGKVQMLEQELEHKREEVDGLQSSLQAEGQKRIEGEAALLLLTNQHCKSQEEVDRLTLEIEKLNGKLSEVGNSKVDLENMITKHTEDIRILSKQNLSSELIIKDLQCELDALKEMNVKLETEVGFHRGEKEVLQRDCALQKEEKENLEGKHHAMADEMAAVKSNSAKLQQLLEEFQITNSQLKEVCAKHEVKKALLSEKVQEMEKLCEDYSLLENSLSDANAEMEALRENIKSLEDSESSLKDEVSLHVSQKAALASELEILGKKFTEISEKNSILDISLSDMNARLQELTTKLQDSEESCQAHLANNSSLFAEKNNIFSQLESITMVMKALEGKHADLEDKHSSLSREKDLAYIQVRELQDQLGIKTEEYESIVRSHQMHINDFRKQISSLQEKNHNLDEMLELEQQKSVSAFISILILESTLADVKDKNFVLFNECQNYVEANHHAEMLISRLKEEARNREEDRKELRKHNEKLREGISHHMKVLNICKDLGPSDIAHDEILLQTVLHETFKLLKLREESEDENMLMKAELAVLATILMQIGLELRDLRLQKCDLEKEVESGAAELLSLQNKNHQLLEFNEQLLQKGCKREEVLKNEVLDLHEKLSYLRETYQTSQDEIANLTEKNESLLQKYQVLVAKYNALDNENGAVLSECMMFEHLSLFFRGHNNEIASALASLTDEMALLSLVKDELAHEFKVLSRRVVALEEENKHLKESLVYLVEVLRTRLVLSEFDFNTSRSVCQELAIELESCMAQLMQKDDELLEAEEKVQFFQEKNRELCGVLGALQVAIEGAKVVKEELEKKISTLTEEGTMRDNENLLLRQANEMLLGKVQSLKEKEESLTSSLELMSKEIEEHERELLVLVSDIITSSVNAAVYEERIIELMMEGKSLETSAMNQKEMLIKEISSRDAHIDELQKRITGMQGENAELKAELGAYLPLIVSLSDHVSMLEDDTFSLSKLYNLEGKEEPAAVPYMQEDNHGPEAHHSPTGASELQKLIARVKALQAVILDAKNCRDQESTESAARLAAANVQIQELKSRGGSHMSVKEQCTHHEKQKDDAESSKGKQAQTMKDIELDQVSTCLPYGSGAALYPLGSGANAELDDEMLQLWETAERDCKNQTAKSSSSEHDIQAVEEVKSEYPSSELARGRDLGIDKLEMSTASQEPQQVWSKNVLERLASDAQRLLSIQASIEELKQKIEGSPKGKSPMNPEYNSIRTQLHETEGFVLEQINFNNKLMNKAENYPALSDCVNAEQEGYSSRRKISEQVQKGSENVARLELELQKLQYVLLKLEEEHEYRRLKVPDKRTRVLLRDYLYGRKDSRGGGHQKKNKRMPFCGCVRPKSRTEP